MKTLITTSNNNVLLLKVHILFYFIQEIVNLSPQLSPLILKVKALSLKTAKIQTIKRRNID